MDCAIVGAGPSGLLLALLLARAGQRVQVLEQQPNLDTPMGGVVLQPGTLGLLARVGLLPALQAGGTAIVGVDETGPAGLLFAGDYAELPDTPSPCALAVPLRLVRQLLLELVDAEPGVSIRTGAQVLALRQHPAHCELDVRIEGQTVQFEAAYVVGADGKYSTVRTAAGLTADVAPFPDRQIIARMPRPDGWPARVRSHRAERPVVVVPSGEHVIHVFAAVATEDPTHALSELAGVLDGYDSQLASGLRAGGEQLALIRHHTVRVSHWSRGRVTLIGDSAHSVHPYGGQGMNLGLQDALLLAGILDRALRADAGSRSDGRTILTEFELLRRPFVERFQASQQHLLQPGAADRTLYVSDFAELALGQQELRPLLR